MSDEPIITPHSPIPAPGPDTARPGPVAPVHDLPDRGDLLTPEHLAGLDLDSMTDAALARLANHVWRVYGRRMCPEAWRVILADRGRSRTTGD